MLVLWGMAFPCHFYRSRLCTTRVKFHSITFSYSRKYILETSVCIVRYSASYHNLGSSFSYNPKGAQYPLVGDTTLAAFYLHTSYIPQRRGSDEVLLKLQPRLEGDDERLQVVKVSPALPTQTCSPLSYISTLPHFKRLAYSISRCNIISSNRARASDR